VLEEVGAAAAGLGIVPTGVLRSPITGTDGNVEFLVDLRAGTTDPGTAFAAAVREATHGV
jgi:predicted rRNA methylase YqxC with S4 and FtsJ domains